MNPIDSFKGAYRFLSNFHHAEVQLDGVTYATTEHAYQAAKSLSPAIREHIRSRLTPREAKRAGSKMDLRPDWEAVKVEVMRGLLVQKFDPSRHPDLATMLAATSPHTLVEGNYWHDQF